jgi:O-antigen ligase
MWRIGLRLFAQHPIAGSGFTGFAPDEKLVPGIGVIDPDVRALRHFHNDWIHTAVFGGMLLLAAQVASVVLLARAARADPFRLWLLFAAVAFGLADVVLHGKVTLSFFVAAWALYSAAFRNETAAPHPVPG